MKHMFYVQYSISPGPLLSLKVIKHKWLFCFVMLAEAVLDTTHVLHLFHAVCRDRQKFVFEILKSKAKVTEFLRNVYIAQFV